MSSAIIAHQMGNNSTSQGSNLDMTKKNQNQFLFSEALINKLVQTIRTPTHCPIRTNFINILDLTPLANEFYCVFKVQFYLHFSKYARCKLFSSIAVFAKKVIINFSFWQMHHLTKNWTCFNLNIFLEVRFEVSDFEE